MLQVPKLLRYNWTANAVDVKKTALIAEQIDVQERTVVSSLSSHPLSQRAATANLLLVRFQHQLPTYPGTGLSVDEALWNAVHTAWAIYAQDQLWPDTAKKLMSARAAFAETTPPDDLKRACYKLLSLLTLQEWQQLRDNTSPKHKAYVTSIVSVLETTLSMSANTPLELFKKLRELPPPDHMSSFSPVESPVGTILPTDEFVEDTYALEIPWKPSEHGISLPEEPGYRDITKKALGKSGKMSIDILADREGRTYKARAYRQRAMDAGPRLRSIHRLLSDGRVFTQRHRAPGGTLLIDTSGSMDIDTGELMQLLSERPATQIALYSGNHDTGTLSVIARKGRALMNPDRIDNVISIAGGGNIIDAPALLWLAKQPTPRWWICDGGVTGIGDKQFISVKQACRTIVTRAHITRYSDLSTFMKPKHKRSV